MPRNQDFLIHFIPQVILIFRQTENYLRSYRLLHWLLALRRIVSSFTRSSSMLLIFWFSLDPEKRVMGKLYLVLYSFSRTAITKYQGLGGLNNRNLLSHNSGGWKSKVKVLEGLVFSEASHLDLQMVMVFLCLHMGFSLYVSVSKCPLVIRTPVILGLHPTLIVSF